MVVEGVVEEGVLDEGVVLLLPLPEVPVELVPELPELPVELLPVLFGSVLLLPVFDPMLPGAVLSVPLLLPRLPLLPVLLVPLWPVPAALPLPDWPLPLLCAMAKANVPSERVAIKRNFRIVRSLPLAAGCDRIDFFLSKWRTWFDGRLRAGVGKKRELHRGNRKLAEACPAPSGCAPIAGGSSE